MTLKVTPTAILKLTLNSDTNNNLAQWSRHPMLERQCLQRRISLPCTYHTSEYSAPAGDASFVASLLCDNDHGERQQRCEDGEDDLTSRQDRHQRRLRLQHPPLSHQTAHTPCVTNAGISTGDVVGVIITFIVTSTGRSEAIVDRATVHSSLIVNREILKV